MSHLVKGETDGNLISALTVGTVKVIAIGLVGVCLSNGELVTLVALTFYIWQNYYWCYWSGPLGQLNGTCILKPKA